MTQRLPAHPTDDCPVTGPTGYGHAAYAAALAEFGTPRHLPQAGGWVLERAIPGTAARDAMGCYPLFTCEDWMQLGADLAAVGTDLVSMAIVTDPMADADQNMLARTFDRVVPFKPHFIVDYAAPGYRISSHHRYYAKKATAGLVVSIGPPAPEFLDTWLGLYDTLIARHGIGGMRAFSRASFAAQLQVPGLVVAMASVDGEVCGAHLWYEQGTTAYSHLAAFSPLGYDRMASYALYAAAIDFFRSRVRYLDIGAGAGLQSDGQDGLTRFKRGWASGVRPVYFCGRIFDPPTYRQLVAAHAHPTTAYFPAYRHGEFA
jgi:hypothetical protein